MIVVDAKDAVVGRLSAFVAKKLLCGEKIVVVNAEHAVISGDVRMIVSVYKRRRGIQQKSNPEHSAKWPRRPDLLLRKIISGMLPKHAPRRKTALRRLKVFLGVPENVSSEKALQPVKKKDALHRKFVSLKKICERLGWQPLL